MIEKILGGGIDMLLADKPHCGCGCTCNCGAPGSAPSSGYFSTVGDDAKKGAGEEAL